MCISYGLTRYSNRQYILDWFEEKIHADGCPSPFCDKEYYSAVHYLANKVWQAIDEVIDLPKRCMKWLQDVSKILSKTKDLLCGLRLRDLLLSKTTKTKGVSCCYIYNWRGFMG